MPRCIFNNKRVHNLPFQPPPPLTNQPLIKISSGCTQLDLSLFSGKADWLTDCLNKKWRKITNLLARSRGQVKERFTQNASMVIAQFYSNLCLMLFVLTFHIYRFFCTECFLKFQSPFSVSIYFDCSLRKMKRNWAARAAVFLKILRIDELGGGGCDGGGKKICEWT